MTDDVTARIEALLAEAAIAPGDAGALRDALRDVAALADVAPPAPSADVAAFLASGTGTASGKRRPLGIGFTGGLLALGALILGVSAAWATTHSVPTPRVPAAPALSTSAPTSVPSPAVDPPRSSPAPELSSADVPSSATDAPQSDGGADAEQATDGAAPSDLSQSESGDAGRSGSEASSSGGEGSGHLPGSSGGDVPMSSSDGGSR